jgi:hypothetical protein
LQIIFLDNPARPDALNQRILADDRSTSVDQRHHHVKRARAEFQRPIVSEQLAAVQQDPEPAELEYCWRIGSHGNRSSTRFQRVSRFFRITAAHRP